MNCRSILIVATLCMSVFLGVVSFGVAQESPVDFPERQEPGLREGFENPPSGYGEVP